MGSLSLHRRFQFFRVLYHRNNLLIPGRAGRLFYLNLKLSFLYCSACIHIGPFFFFHRNPFSGKRGLINHCLPLHDDSVQRDHVSHMHTDNILLFYAPDIRQDLRIPFQAPYFFHI